jgi:hypothetical protein
VEALGKEWSLLGGNLDQAPRIGRPAEQRSNNLRRARPSAAQQSGGRASCFLPSWPACKAVQRSSPLCCIGGHLLRRNHPYNCEQLLLHGPPVGQAMPQTTDQILLSALGELHGTEQASGPALYSFGSAPGSLPSQ